MSPAPAARRPAALRLSGDMWRPAPVAGIAWIGGEAVAPDRAGAESALEAIDSRWAERRRHPRPGGGLFVGATYEFGVRLAGLPVAASGPAIRWFDVEAAGSDAEAPRGAAGRATRSERRVTASLGHGAYAEAVETIRESIRRGRYYQANLCRAFRVRGAPPPAVVWRALPGPAASPAAAACIGRDRAWLSFSPETFLVGSLGGRIRTVPIKGSRPRGTTPEQDRDFERALRASAKDRAELTMIVDLERNDLVKVCRPGSVSRHVEPRLEKFSEMMHLVGDVEGALRPDVAFADLMRAAFPGGSISGAPKRAAMAALANLEPEPRGLFSGALWWLGDDGDFRSSIAIRTLEWHGDRVRFGAGGGITWGSSPEEEWQEANAKARPFARALGFEPEDAPC